MTVEDMARAAALLSYRDDEFIKDDEGNYEDEGLRILEICLNAFNEASAEVARKLCDPVTTVTVTPENYRVDLTGLDPAPIQILRIEDVGLYGVVSFRAIDRNTLEVNSTRPVKITYNCLPDRLEELTDEPVFHEGQVPPDLFIMLAAARLYQSEKKHETAAPFEAMYYDKLRRVKPVAASSARRLPRRTFR